MGRRRARGRGFGEAVRATPAAERGDQGDAGSGAQEDSAASSARHCRAASARARQMHIGELLATKASVFAIERPLAHA